ncbi:MAG: YraN family protein [Spirochaetes bacterium]|uniref:UPF0102 protein IAA96_08280 n=1 Tax=Candidatus Avitreponema avistercoris TaxID=2840705 RepID=A0A9D9EQX5_9SPIR|nr:YraN family protein [Candidatus Avitreponema avistercoris]
MQTGRAGEAFVAQKLAADGWKICARNWRRRSGEIDIIAEDGGTLVFVEVKTWPGGRLEDLEYVIHREKRRRMIGLAKTFVAEHPEYEGFFLRFDIVFLGPEKDGMERGIRHLRAAFTE